MFKKIVALSLCFSMSIQCSHPSIEAIKAVTLNSPKYLPYAFGIASAALSAYRFNNVFKGESVSKTEGKNYLTESASYFLHFLNMMDQIAIPSAAFPIKLGTYVAASATACSSLIQKAAVELEIKNPLIFYFSQGLKIAALVGGFGLNRLFWYKYSLSH
jgi:hypothetical protein